MWMWPPCGITDVKNVYGKLLFLVLSGFRIWEWGTSFSSLSSYNLLLRGQHCDFVHAPCIYALVPPEMSRMVQGATQKPHGEDTVTGRNQNSLPKSHPALHKNSNLQILRNKTSKEASILCKLKYRNGAVKRTLGSLLCPVWVWCGCKGCRAALWQNCPKPSADTLPPKFTYGGSTTLSCWSSGLISKGKAFQKI